MFGIACYIFACNPVQLSLESIKGNLLTYLLHPSNWYSVFFLGAVIQKNIFFTYMITSVNAYQSKNPVVAALIYEPKIKLE